MTGLALALAGLVACQPHGMDSPPTTVFPDPEPVCSSTGTSTPAVARLLTAREYRQTVRDLLLTTTDPTADFPPEPRVNGFANNASSHQTNPLLVEMYFHSAQRLADEAASLGLHRLHLCDSSQSEFDCATGFVEHFGQRAYRRPLSALESESLLALYQRAAPTFGHQEALVSILEAMLQSPQFLYRVEAPISSGQGSVIALGPYELASRLSYFLLGTMPDQPLLQAARDDALRTPEQIAIQARRLLQDPRAIEQTREFFSSWLGLDQTGSIARLDAPPGFAPSARESVLRFAESVFWSGTSTTYELYSSPRLFVDDTLAGVYGLPPPGPGNWAQYDVPDERRGLLTQPGLMTLFAHADQSSPIQRGVFVRDKIFCSPVEPPPPSVDNNPPDPQPGLTTRELFEVHTANPACARCHSLIDPVGFGFEAYDQLGRFRATENGDPIDTTGELTALDEEDILGPFDGALELGTRIATSDTVLECLTHKWFTFAMGRSHGEADHCSIEAALKQANTFGGSLKELLVGLTTSDSFRFRAAHESDSKGDTP